MASSKFDKILRDKLKNLSTKFNPSDWIIMERLLEWQGLSKTNGEADEVSFDELAIDKLQNINTSDMTPNWDRMSEMLNQLDLEGKPSIESSELDQAINNKLKGFEVELDEAAWIQLAPTLDADRMIPVQELDHVTKEKLGQIEDPDPAWSTMSNKITRELFLPESVVKYKVVEIALVLLFAISLYQLPIVDQLKDKVITAENSISDPIEDSKELNSQGDLINPTQNSRIEPLVPVATLDQDQKIQDVESLTKAKIRIKNEDLISQIQNEEAYRVEMKVDQEEVTSSELAPSVSDFLNAINSENLFSVKHSIFQGVKDKLPLFGLFANRVQQAYYLSSEIINTDIFGNQLSEKESTTVAMLATIDQAPIDEIEASKEKARVSCLTCGNKDQKVGLALGLFTGSDYNQIVTPFDPVYALDGTTQWNIGYGGGLSLSMQFKSWELEMGAIYSSNQYQPREVFEIYSGSISSGYIASTLKDIELDIVKVPLNFRFNLNLKDNWKIYALSGATMNMVIQSAYITDDVYIGRNSFATPSAPVKSSDLDLKDFSGGILEGGRFSDNSFLTANLGLGVERTLNNKWSLFAQPTYQRQIFSNGIGPNQDRFNSLSLFFGTRLSIK